MNLFEITLQPSGAFGTPLKGDTIFGHFCWQAQHEPSLLAGGLTDRMVKYHERPFIVFSSAFPKLDEGEESFYALKRPDLPLSLLFSRDSTSRCRALAERKEKKAKRWMLVKRCLEIDLRRAECFLSDGELSERMRRNLPSALSGTGKEWGERAITVTVTQAHNTIHRLRQTTGTGPFAPFTMENIFYQPGTRLALFVLIDKEVACIESVCRALERIGRTGFGRDASTGLGRFEVLGHDPIDVPRPETANALYCLSPSVPEMDHYEDVFFSPFVRFGKHGDALARSRNPFKNPVVMADEGAVLIPREQEMFKKEYHGRGISGVSLVQPESVTQGYTVCLPFRLEK